MGLSLLPPLRRFSKNRNSPWSFRGHMLYCISRTILNRTNPNPEAKENMFLLPKLLFPPKQTTTALGNHSHKSQFSCTWSLLKEPSVLSLATRKHLPVLPTVTYTVLTRCSESDPVTEPNPLWLKGDSSNSHTFNILPKCVFWSFLWELHISSIQGIPTFSSN